MKIQANQSPWSNLQSPATRLQSLANDTLHVDNVRWGLNEEGKPLDWSGRFSDATIDPRAVKDVYIGVKPFAPTALAAHTTLIFEMDEEHPVSNSQGQKDPALVLSMEARLHQGEDYSMKETLKGTYPVVYQLQTWTDLVQKSTRREALQQIRYKLDLNAQQQEQLLRNTLEKACSPYPNERYNLLTHSCHTAVIDLVNSVQPEEKQIDRWILPHVYNPMALLPSVGDVLFAGHDWFTQDNRLLVPPDARLHPQAAQGPSKMEKVGRAVSGSVAWKPLCALSGACAGAALGSTLGSALPGPLGMALGGVLGSALTLSLGETVRRRSHTDYVPASQFLPN